MKRTMVIGILVCGLTAAGAFYYGRQAGSKPGEEHAGGHHEGCPPYAHTHGAKGEKSKASSQQTTAQGGNMHHAGCPPYPHYHRPKQTTAGSPAVKQGSVAKNPKNAPKSKEIIEAQKKALREKLKDPQYWENLAAERRGTLEKQYKSYIGKVHLSEEESAQLLQMLTERRLSFDRYLAELANETSKLDISSKEARQHVLATNSQYDNQIRALLGKKRYTELTLYNSTLPARMHINEVLSNNPPGVTFNSDQMELLVDIYARIQAKTPNRTKSVSVQEMQYNAFFQQAQRYLTAEEYQGLTNSIRTAIAVRRKQ